ncbi:MAG TPA: hypothetical protein PK072_07985, partial [Quisquiliibacterium sp.]|nr:hypothetical protein [Quisquiliibacterium sp.]
MLGQRTRLAVQRQQRLRLCVALPAREVLEVRGHHPHRTLRGGQRGHGAQARHRGGCRVGRPRQRVVPHLQHGQTRGDQVAELAARAVGPALV